MKTTKILFLLTLLGSTGILSSGCATYKTIEKAEYGSPKFFSGTRLNVHAINKNRIALKKFSVTPPKYPLLDLPGSMVLDLVVSPLTGGMAAYETLMD